MRKVIIGNRLLAILHDLAMVPVAWLGAYWLRFNLGVIPDDYFTSALQNLLIVMVIQMVVFRYFGLYRGVWRFASIPDLIRIGKAVLVGAAFTAVSIFLLTRMEGVPRSVFPLYCLLLVALLGGARLAVRWSKDHGLYDSAAKKVLIVGAGRAGEMLVRDLLRTHDEGYVPAGFVDDSVQKQGREIHGVRVLGSCTYINAYVKQMGIDLIVLAVPSAKAKQMRRLVDLCEKTSIPFRTLPPLENVMSGEIAINQLREVSIEDLLGREPVSLDWQVIEHGISGERLLVTGAGGSIGSELCRQIAALKPSYLILIDNSEFNLYSIERELREANPDLEMDACLVNVVDRESVERVMAAFKPSVIFHAAAYKHVPMLEGQIREAIKNNILGTWTIAKLADKYNCKTFVMISTDKAVNPANVMGTTKRAAEIFCQNLDGHSSVRFVTVRFGNVLGSAGSVVPLFQKQIKEGGPVTVTHPEITRYFMTIPEACQLIMQSGMMGSGGEIFVLDMGEPIKISYLAEQMIRLSGKVPDEDISIIYTGLRPGEKLYEELFHENEALQSTRHSQILLARHREFDWGRLNEVIECLELACKGYDEAELRKLLKELVPEWSGSDMNLVQTPGFTLLTKQDMKPAGENEPRRIH